MILAKVYKTGEGAAKRASFEQSLSKTHRFNTVCFLDGKLDDKPFNFEFYKAKRYTYRVEKVKRVFPERHWVVVAGNSQRIVILKDTETSAREFAGYANKRSADWHDWKLAWIMPGKGDSWRFATEAEVVAKKAKT